MTPYGLGLLKAFVVILALALFVVPWAWFIQQTWGAETVPDLNDGLVYLANLSAGVLAAAFAAALGVQAGGNGGGGLGASLAWPSAPDWTKLALTICVWVYFVVGVGVVVVYFKDTSIAPPEVKDFALLFVGYAVAYLAVLLRVTRT